MAYRTLEVTLISGKDLKDVNLFSKMEVYAVVSIGDPRSAQRTHADRVGGSNPAWNHALTLSLPADDPSRHVLRVLLRAERALGDRDVGEVHIPLKELLDGASGKGPQFVSYQVRTPNSGKAKGVLNLSYKFGDASAANTAAPSAAYPAPQKAGGEPVMAYPSGAAAAAAAAYPPPARGSKVDDHFPAYPGGAGAVYPPPATAGKADKPVTAYPGGTGASYPPPAKAGKADEPVTAYPAGSSAGASYPPPGAAAPYPHSAGYPAYPPPTGYSGQPPQSGYGYPPAGYPPAGYGYPPPPQAAGYGYQQPAGYGYGAQRPAAVQPAKKNKFGLGMGAGLLGGAVGGLLLGDMISDAGSYDSGYDGGYDGGFDDGGGFDF